MERRFRGATILAVIAIAVIAFIVWGLPALTEGDATPTPEVGGMEDLLFPEASSDVVTHFRVTDNETGDTVAGELDEGSGTATNWAITEAPEGSDTGLGVDADRILMNLAYLPTLRPSRVLSNVEMLASYGLTDPRYTIEFTTSGGDTYEMQVGGKNPGDAAYYVQTPGSDNVYLIWTYNLDPVIEFLETPPFKTPTPEPGATSEPTLEPDATAEATAEATPTPTEEAEEEERLGDSEPLFPESEEESVTSIRITDHRTDEVIVAEVGASATEWVITEAPEGTDLTQAADVRRIIGELFDLPGLEGREVENPVDLDTYDLDEPRYTIEFTTSDGEEYRLDIGEESDDDEDYYVLVNEDEDEVFRVSVDVIDPLLDWLDDPPFAAPSEDNDNAGGSSSATTTS